MGTNTTIYLYYTRNTYTLTLALGTNITAVTGGGTYKVGKSVTIDATLASQTGYDISWSSWTSSNTSLLADNSTRNATITMPAGNVTLTANATKSVIYYTVTCIDKVGSSSGTTLGTSTWTAAYGTTASGSTKGTSTTVGAYYSGYTYSSCTSTTVSGNVTVYRYFTLASAGDLSLTNGSWKGTITSSSANYYFANLPESGSTVTLKLTTSFESDQFILTTTSSGVTLNYAFEGSGTMSLTLTGILNNLYFHASNVCSYEFISITNADGIPYNLK